jgi:hypothetical protein
MKKYMEEIFNLRTSIYTGKNDVKKIGYCYVELGEDIFLGKVQKFGPK